MYKVFFKESLFLLTDRLSLVENSSCSHIYQSPQLLHDFVYRAIERDVVFNAVLYAADVEELFCQFVAQFKWVEAAGGVVERDDAILVIERWNVPDLPKGHIEKGETPEQCAVREVQEECGVGALSILHVLPSTLHIYDYKGTWNLKKCYWFAMSTSDDKPLIPQREEDIEKAYWLPKSEIPSILSSTYRSLRPVLQYYLDEAE